MSKVCVLLLSCLFMSSAAAAEPLVVIRPDGRTERIPVIETEGGEYLPVDEVSLLYGASRYWRPDLLKMTVRLGDHRVKLTAENPVVVVDGEAIHLRSPVLYRDGLLLLPLELAGEILAPLAPFPARWDPGERTLRIGSAARLILYAEVRPLGSGREVTVWTLGGPEFQAGGEPGDTIRIDFAGVELPGDSLPDPPGDGLLEDWFWEVRRDTATLHLVTGERLRDWRVARRARPEGVVVRLSPTEMEEEGAGASEAVKVLTGPADRKRRGKPRLVLDPGHGGSDAGLICPNGLTEKELTLDLAKRIRERLVRAGVDVSLTREEDEDLPLLRRVEIANGASADLLISLHLNGSAAPGRSGVEVYFLSGDPGAVERSRLAVAETAERFEREPLGTIPGGEIRFVPWDSVQDAHREDSGRAARELLAGLSRSGDFRALGVREAPLAALRGADLPALLLEVGFGTNETDRRALASAERRERLADAIAGALGGFLRGSSRE